MNFSDSHDLVTQKDEFRFTVGRLTCQLHMPETLPDPYNIRDRLTRLAEEELSKTLSASLGALAGNDQSVYRIRRLNLDLWVDTQAMSAAEMSQRWSKGLVKAASRAIQEPGSMQVMRYESPRHYLTAFLRDVLDGHAWNCWYYDEFRPLQRLSAPEMITLLLARYPDWMISILLDLDASGHAHRLIESLGKSQVDRLWAAMGFPGAAEGVGSSSDLDWLAGIWRGLALSGGPSPDARARDRLRLWLGVARLGRERARDPNLDGWLRAIVDLYAILRAWPELAPVLMMESGLFPAALHMMATGPLSDTVGWLAALSQTSHGRLVLKRLTQTVELQGTSSASQNALTSPFGGIFLLLPSLIASKLWDVWVAEEGEERARWYLYILALKALGHAHASSALNDPLLSAFAGLTASADSNSYEASDRQPAHISWIGALGELSQKWFRSSSSDLTVARLGVPEIEMGDLEILRDSKSSVWLAARPGSGKQDRMGSEDILWPGVGTRSHLIPNLDPMSLDMEKIKQEAEHFHVGQSPYNWLTPALDAALSVASSMVLRRFSVSLTGMGSASPAYLARQFLAQPADLQRHTSPWRLQLSGGPLRVVLQLSGLPEQVEPPWLPAPVAFHLDPSA